jgi:hypothetical protein
MAALLNLDTINVDRQLLRRVPYALCRYYLALPLGQENGSVSVAMAYPENDHARHILAGLLQAEVVPVFVPAESLQAALARNYPPSDQQRLERILGWYDGPESATAVATATSELASTLQVEAALVHASEQSLNRVLQLAAAEQHGLIVCPRPANPTLAWLISHAPAPLLFVRQPLPPMRRMLVVMRGFASDERMLDWLLSFAWQYQAGLTLLLLTHDLGQDIGQYHQTDSLAGRHLARCLDRLKVVELVVDLKFRQGDAVEQVLEEVSGAEYDLLALAAEAGGSFVRRVIATIDQRQVHNGRPIFVLTPPELAGRQGELPDKGA